MPIPPIPTANFLTNLPKAELHLHVEGTLEPDLKLKLATRNNIELKEKTVEEIQATYDFVDLTSFLAVYYPAMDVLQKEEDFYELANAYFKRAAQDGVKRVEMFFDPQAHTSRGVAFEAVVRGYHRATVEAAKVGISAELIMCFLRDFSAESAAETLAAALPYKNMILGVGLDSDERGNPPAKFAQVFADARSQGYKLTMHCDIDQDQSIENIRQVIEDIGVDRIDHGTNIVENPDLVQVIKDRGIGLTCCPVSNQYVTEEMKSAEMLALLNQGVKVTLNSDDPAYFGGYIAKNFIDFAEHTGATTEQMIRLAMNSFEISWITAEEKLDYLTKINEYVGNYGNE